MKILLPLAVLPAVLSFTTPAGAQVERAWAVTYTGRVAMPFQQNIDRAFAVAADHAGHVYVLGESYGPDPGQNITLIQYDTNGMAQWIVRYGPADVLGDVPVALALDDAGFIYVLANDHSFTGVVDILTLKYDPSGNLLWEARYGHPSNSSDEARVNCFIEESGDEACRFDGIIIKYSPEGQELWADGYNGPANLTDLFDAVTVDRFGHAVVTGETPLPEFSGWDLSSLNTGGMETAYGPSATGSPTAN